MIKFIKENISEEYINLFKEANFFANKSLGFIDRTEANSFFIPLLLEKIPKEKNNIQLSFKELCEKRALELLHIGKRINIMWSGGIDSTVVALMLHQEGYEVIGITMKTWDYATAGGSKKETGCCNLDSFNDEIGRAHV